MGKLTKEEALYLMKNTPWSFYYNALSKNDTERDAFSYKNHEVIDKIGSDIRCSNIDTGWDGVDTYDYLYLYCSNHGSNITEIKNKIITN